MPLNLFQKELEQQELPEAMKDIVVELKNLSGKEECLRRAYEVLTQKYHGSRIKTGLKIYEIFIHDITVLWKKNGFLHCTNLNYLLKILLIESGHFSESDIHMKWTLIWFISPHQFVKVRLEDAWVAIDIWGHRYGVKYGEYSHGFH